MSMIKQVALVEDDDVIRANYADLLRQAGFVVATYADKASALAAFARALPDVALPGQVEGKTSTGPTGSNRVHG